MLTFDRRTVDSTGAFLIGELERLDATIHEPLVSVTWGRDIDLREDVTIGDEFSSFTNSTFASPGGINPTGKAWIGKKTNAITGVELDIGKTANRLHLWGMELSYTIPELESAARLGRPIDQQKFDAIKLKHQMDIDEMVYVGDSSLAVTGLINSPQVTVTTAPTAGTASPTGNSTSTRWADKTADEILADVNAALTGAWAASGWAVMPSELRLPPQQFGQLVATKVSTAGNLSVIEYLKVNSLSNAINGRPLNIQPLKWLQGAGTSGTNNPTLATPAPDRALAYTKDRNRVRYPLVPLQRTPLENRSIYQITTYFGRLGQVELVYPETVAYLDGI
ncbi:MAG TPA: DUF2184 domain-containing protein [Bryobacteraceae bacterium]|jgi:hypothetical protein|nr:DUF2184 domain-containing protein [Bryobacteraceae bacterium]